MKTKGYIYVRTHESYDVHMACKLGYATNIPERDMQYATSEIKRGKFALVIEVGNPRDVEKSLQLKFAEFKIYHDAGTEFYNKYIIGEILPFLDFRRIKYAKLTEQEIKDLVRCSRPSTIQPRIKYKTYTPRPEQEEIIEKSVDHFTRNSKGTLVLVCGIGKTLIALWIAKQLNQANILIGVPNLLLLEQWKSAVNSIFPNRPLLLVSGTITAETLECYMRNNNAAIVITTYASAYKAKNIIFNMIIYDECHHLATSYLEMLTIKGDKCLALTATLKQIEGEAVEIIDRKNVLYGIKHGIICDYVIQTLVTDSKYIEFANKQLLFSAYAALKSIAEGHAHHLLIYCNNSKNAEIAAQSIQTLLNEQYFNIDIYYSEYHSNMSHQDQKTVLAQFKAAKYAIIVCVYCLGEGWDCPLLDGVVFAENMTSNIRIVQSALRASRINRNDTKKITKIILPILDKNFQSIKEVIYQMGLEDITISQKIKAYHINVDKHYNTRTDGKYDMALTHEMRLKTITRPIISYSKAVSIIAEHNIKSKAEYAALCDCDIRLPLEPNFAFRDQFNNWFDYLSISRAPYYTLEECRLIIRRYYVMHRDIFNILDLDKTSSNLCEIDTRFPPVDLWLDCYEVGSLSDIIKCGDIKKRAGIL